MHSIYKIRTYSEGSNSYGVSRAERWVVEVDCECKELQEAKDYVKSKSREFTILPNVLQSWRETKPEHQTIKTEDELIEKFCFTDDQQLKHRRFFIGKPDLEAIQKALINDGVQIIQTK